MYPRELLTYLTFNKYSQAKFGHVSSRNDKLFQELSEGIIKMTTYNFVKKLAFMFIFRISNQVFPSYFQPLYDLRAGICDNTKIMVDQRRRETANKIINEEDLTFIDHSGKLTQDENVKYTPNQEIADIYLCL